MGVTLTVVLVEVGGYTATLEEQEGGEVILVEVEVGTHNPDRVVVVVLMVLAQPGFMLGWGARPSRQEMDWSPPKARETATLSLQNNNICKCK